MKTHNEIKVFPPQDFPAPCGCKVRFDTDGLIRWEMCKLHAASRDLLDALGECITNGGAHCLAYGADAPTLRRRLDSISKTAREAITKATA